MNRDLVWLIVVVILASNTLLLLSSEDAADPNLIDIEDLTCSSGEILVGNTSFIEGYDYFDSILTALPTLILLRCCR